MRIPLELLVVLGLAVVLPTPARRALCVVAGAVLSVIVVVKFLDMGFFSAFNRPFKPVDDLHYVGIGIETLGDAIGRTAPMSPSSSSPCSSSASSSSPSSRCCA